MYNLGQEIVSEHIKALVKKQEEVILNVFKKQSGFINVEESKHLIEIRNMVKKGEHVGTDYVFDGKVILTIYPPKFTEEGGRFNATVNYLEHP